MAGVASESDTTPDATGSVPGTAVQTSVPLDFTVDRTIGRFELIRELGRGGMGQVFLGRDTKLGRRVAIKFLLGNEPRVVQRFVLEARATAAVTHDNIVTIFEVGEHRGLPYMVLEYLEGQTLADVIESSPSVRQFIELMLPVARALERAHEHGIVHRDLKPSNVFVTDRGQVKVLDFGIARILDQTGKQLHRVTAARSAIMPAEMETPVTDDKAILGTLPYLSPEQWGSDEVDTLTDIWAMGIMFWRALVGLHPAGVAAPHALQYRLRTLDVPLPSIGEAGPTLPPDLVAIVDKCLALRKSDRYQRASDVVRDLERVLQPKNMTSERPPFRGLAAFGEGDADLFFGRSNEVRSAMAQLDAWPVLAIIGPSGVGKSSFVHAGLVPTLRAQAPNVTVRHLRPGRWPLLRLGEALREASTSQLEGLAEVLAEAPGVFGAELRRLAESQQQRIVIVVDQLEELFTLCDDERARQAFLSALLGAADDPSSPIRVVFSMRADFLDRLAGEGAFAELSRALFFLASPQREGLREALVRPVQLSGYQYETPDIIEQMIGSATSGGALPLLAFAANRLWEARDPHRRLLTWAAYQQMGGVGGAFAGHAEHVAAAIPAQHAKLLRTIVLRLVTPEGTRAVVDHSDLTSLSREPRDVEQVIDHLARARLIHVHTDHGRATVEIVHETLISEWPTLRRWLDEGQAARVFAHELSLAARQWAARGKPDDLVWRGKTARTVLSRTDIQLVELAQVEREFLAAIAAEMNRAARRRNISIIAAALAVSIGVIGASIAFVRIRSSEQRAVASEHQAQSDKTQAEADRAAAVAAKVEVDKQLDVVHQKELERDAAEKQAAAAAKEASEANSQLGLSREDLAKTNDELARKVAEARTAQATAEAATKEATQAKNELEKKLAEERKKREDLEAHKSALIGTLHAE